MTTSNENIWLNQTQAAEYLCVTNRTIRRYIVSGALPASRVNGSRLIRIKQSDLDDLLTPIKVNELVEAAKPIETAAGVVGELAGGAA